MTKAPAHERARKLARLQRGPTRYEVLLTRKDEEPILIVYTARKSFRELLQCVQHQGFAILAHTGHREEATMQRQGQTLILGDWTIKFGRTQREAITEGEYPFILDLATV